MAWALVTSSPASTTSTATNSYTISPGASVATGQRIFVATSTWREVAHGALTTPSITDSVNSGSYTEDIGIPASDGGFYAFRVSIFSKVATGTGTPTITVTVTNSEGNGCVCWAVSGLSSATDATAIDKSATATGTGGTASAGATTATTAANEYVAGVYGDDGWAAVGDSSGNAGAGWTYVKGSGHSGPSGDVFVEHQDSGSSGTTPTASLATSVPGGSTTWAMMGVVYKLAGGGAAQDTPELYDRHRKLRQILAQ